MFPAKNFLNMGYYILRTIFFSWHFFSYSHFYLVLSVKILPLLCINTFLICTPMALLSPFLLPYIQLISLLNLALCDSSCEHLMISATQLKNYFQFLALYINWTVQRWAGYMHDSDMGEIILEQLQMNAYIRPQDEWEKQKDSSFWQHLFPDGFLMQDASRSSYRQGQTVDTHPIPGSFLSRQKDCQQQKPMGCFQIFFSFKNAKLQMFVLHFEHISPEKKPPEYFPTAHFWTLIRKCISSQNFGNSYWS